MTNTVKGILQPEMFSLEWKINRFFADCEKVGDCYLSSAFPIQYPNKSTKWYLRVNPKGDKEESKDYVSLYLHMASETEIEEKVDFKLSIVNEQNNLTTCRTTKTFKGQSFYWGWTNVIKHDLIKDVNNKVLVDGTLTISCQIIFHAADQDDAEIFHGYNELLDEIGNGFNDYEKLLESGRFTDVTFNVQEKKINVHKDILSCRSPVFQAMFEHKMKENEQNVVDITDIDYDVMKELFRFIYSGKVRDIVKIANQLLIAADKYSMKELKALCEKCLYDKLTIDNAVEYLKLTEVCDTIHLKRLVIRFTAAHYKEVIEKPGFADLPSNLMHQVLQTIAKK